MLFCPLSDRVTCHLTEAACCRGAASRAAADMGGGGAAAVACLFLACLTLHGAGLCEAGTAADVQRVLDKISLNNPHVRPVYNQSTRIQVRIVANPIAFSSFDEVAQKLSGSMWMDVAWKDELLTWNASEYGDIFEVKPDPAHVWRPNLAILNAYTDLKPVGGDFVLLLLRANGSVSWYPGFTFEIFCKMDVTYFPFDTQTCFFDFFIWGDSKTEIELTPNGPGILMNSYMSNGEWGVHKTWAESADQFESQMPQTRIYISLQRMPTFIIITVVLPVFLMALLNVMVFAIPLESGEKVSFAITVLLSLAVFLSFFTNMMPQTSESVSVLTGFIAIQLALSSLYIVVTIAILRVHQRRPEEPVEGCAAAIVRLQRRFNKRKVLDVTMAQEKGQPVDAKAPVTFESEVTWSQVAGAIDNLCFVVFSVVVFITLVTIPMKMVFGA